jgi:hypothetical protein
MQELKQVLDTWMIGGSEIPLFVQNCKDNIKWEIDR